MIKKVTKVGNSHAIILDSTLMGLMRLKAGDEVNVEIHDGGTMTVAPVRDEIGAEEAMAVIEQTMTDYAETMRKLA